MPSAYPLRWRLRSCYINDEAAAYWIEENPEQRCGACAVGCSSYCSIDVGHRPLLRVGRWAEAAAEGWDVIGFDIERHEYGKHRYRRSS